MTFLPFCAADGCALITKPGDAYCKRCIAEKVNASMKQETIAVPVELVRKLKELASPRASGSLVAYASQLADCARMLPDPPKPDVVEECERARLNAYSRGPMAGDCNWHAMRAALRRYRELRGLPTDPELDE